MVKSIRNKVQERLAKQTGNTALFEPYFSHYGTSRFFVSVCIVLICSVLIGCFCVGTLNANYITPNFKREIEMEIFEDKANINLLQTYLYVSFLDTVTKCNKIELSSQKDLHLAMLSYQSNFSDILCLNLILNDEGLIQ